MQEWSLAWWTRIWSTGAAQVSYKNCQCPAQAIDLSYKKSERVGRNAVLESQMLSQTRDHGTSLFNLILFQTSRAIAIPMVRTITTPSSLPITWTQVSDTTICSSLSSSCHSRISNGWFATPELETWTGAAVRLIKTPHTFHARGFWVKTMVQQP